MKYKIVILISVMSVIKTCHLHNILFGYNYLTLWLFVNFYYLDNLTTSNFIAYTSLFKLKYGVDYLLIKKMKSWIGL